MREILRDQPTEIVNAAELLTSELATNSVRHAHTDFELAIHWRGQVRIEVRDTGRGQPRLLSPSVRESAGRGLLIVDVMADAWGVVPVEQGKIVWFTLPQPSAASEAASEVSAPTEGSDRLPRTREGTTGSRMSRGVRRSPRSGLEQLCVSA